MKQEGTLHILKSCVNSFHYLYQDAELFSRLAFDEAGKSFKQVQYSRTAVLLYAFSMEALINRVIFTFLPDHLKRFYHDHDKSLELKAKWELVPLLISDNPLRHFDKSRLPWSAFIELVKLRNEFVHPKFARYSYVTLHKGKTFDSIDHYISELPSDLESIGKDLVYPLLQIPKDPDSIRPKHINSVKSTVDSTIERLDEILEGRLKLKNWLHSDEFELVWPLGRALSDVKDADLTDHPADKA